MQAIPMLTHDAEAVKVVPRRASVHLQAAKDEGE